MLGLLCFVRHRNSPGAMSRGDAQRDSIYGAKWRASDIPAGKASRAQKSPMPSARNYYTTQAMTSRSLPSLLTTAQELPEPLCHTGRADQHLCPDLIVPPGCECTLLVPLQPLMGGRFNIVDPEGHVVLRAEPHHAHPSPYCRAPSRTLASVCATRASSLSLPGRVTRGADGRLTRLVLSTDCGEELAQCCHEENSDKDSELQILTAAGAHHASIHHDNGGYTLQTVTCQRFHMIGCFQQHRITITDDTNKVVATTSVFTDKIFNQKATDSKGCYQLRIAPGADVGLILCALLCLENLA